MTERVNVTVPMIIRDRMRHKEGVNWSEVASSAFEAALNDSVVISRDRYEWLLRAETMLASIGAILRAEGER